MTICPLVLLFVGFCHAWEELQIIQPSSLANLFPVEGVYHKPAMFGVPSYTTSITGNVIYATEGDFDGCDPLDNSAWPTTGPLIIMVDRGNCTFVSKVRNVQTSSGVAVIIVDNVEETWLPYMADDGTGADISIPSMLITMDDGQLIKDSISNTGYVTVQLTWGLPHPDGRVEWSLWTSSNDPASREMKQTWGPIVESIGAASRFEPHYFIYEGEYSGCTATGFPCGNQCTADGRFCAVDPDHDLSSGISGLDIVEENLRQLCLFEYLNASDTESNTKWWDYTSLFIDQCCQPVDHVTGVCTADAWSEVCSYDVMEQINIADTSAVTECTTTRAEELFEREIFLRAITGIFFLPTLVVNNAAYEGSLACADPVNAFNCGPLEAICAGYASGTAPDACYGDIACPYGESTDCANTCGGVAELDACGLCMTPDSYLYNLTCAGCDGIPYSNLVVDACGVCGGDGSFDACGRCWPADDVNRVDDADVCAAMLNNTTAATSTLTADFSLTVIAVSIAVGALLVVVIACVYAKRQQAQIARIDNVLSSYLPLDQANDFAHSTEADTARMLQVPTAVEI